MCGNGAGTGKEVTPLPRRQILQALLPAPTAWRGAVAGTTTPTTAVLPIAATAPRRAATTVWGFALPICFVQKPYVHGCAVRQKNIQSLVRVGTNSRQIAR